MKHAVYEQWQEGEATLRALGMKINLPENVRIKYCDYFARINDTKAPKIARAIDADGNKLPKRLGAIKMKRLDGQTTKLGLLIDCYEGEGLLALFAQGHEEGHIMDHTCNLFALCNEANRLGYNFDFLSSDAAQKHDNAMNLLYQSYFLDMDRGRFIDALKSYVAPRFNQRELIAHVGGLVSMAKSGQCKNDAILNEISTAIKTDNERWVRLKSKKIFGVQDINKDYFEKLDAERDDFS